MAAAALLLLTLARGHLGTESCMHCGAEYKNLRSRFAQLCAQFKSHYDYANCTKYPWDADVARGFALAELSLDLLLEKTHRVFRVIEINQTLNDFPKYWRWVHEVKMLEESMEAMCPPACQGSTTAINCSTCLKMEMPCWDPDICYPVHNHLQKATMVLSCVAGACLFLGFVACALEFRFRPRIMTEGGEPYQDLSPFQDGEED